MSRTRSALRLAALAVAAFSAAPLAAPLAAQCNPHGSWQSASPAPSIPGLPIGASDVLGVPAVLFSGAIAGSPAPFYLWDGAVELPLAAGPDRTIHFADGAIPFESPSGPVIAVRGLFEIAGVTTVLAFWDGTDWQLPGAAVLGVLRDLAVVPAASGDALWIGGEVGLVGGTLYAGGVARYRASGWDEPAQVSGVVERIAVALEPAGAVLYLEGLIGAIDGAPFWNIARFDGTTWDNLGGGTIDEIEYISVIEGTLGPELWVAGDFDQIGGVPVPGLARRRGGAWEAVPLPIPWQPQSFVPTPFVTVSTEDGDRVAPLIYPIYLPSQYGYLAWDDSAAAWVPLTANPGGAAQLTGSTLLSDGVYRVGSGSPALQLWCHNPEFPFARGDVNEDGAMNIADVIALLAILFQGAPAGSCLVRLDSNADDALNIADAIRILGALFPPGAPNTIPPPTLPNCGSNPNPAGLYCLEPQGGC